MSFSDYIMNIQPPKGFKPPTDIEPYDKSTDPQEHMDAFKSRMALARASDPVKCQVFPITLKKVALKWFNSLPSRFINRFSDLSSLFLAHSQLENSRQNSSPAYSEYPNDKVSRFEIFLSVITPRPFS